MKKIATLLATMAVALTLLVGCEKNDEMVNPNKLPSEAQTFLATNFPNATVKTVVKDYDDATHTYKVTLSDGTFVEFRKSGEWKEVENRVDGVPTSVIPTKIQDYLTTNYPDDFVVDIERERRYDVELNTGLDLEFSLDGDFIRIDM